MMVPKYANISGTLSEKREQMTAAIRETFSTQWEMSVISKRAGGRACPGICDGASLAVNLDISMNPKSRILLLPYM